MSLPRQNLLLHLYPLCRDSPVNMQMFCPMAQESSQLHTMKITLLSGVADPDVQRYFRFLYKISIRHSLPDSCVTFSSHCHLSFSSYYNRKDYTAGMSRHSCFFTIRADTAMQQPHEMTQQPGSYCSSLVMT